MVEAEQQEIDDELEEIKRLIHNKDAANAKRITKLAYNVFSSVVDVAAAEKDLASLDKHVARFFGIIYHLWTLRSGDSAKYCLQ